jgi:hypothetical protein
MTRDEIRLVTFILLALVIGAVVQHFRHRPPAGPVPAATPTPEPRGWAKPPYALKEKSR